MSLFVTRGCRLWRLASKPRSTPSTKHLHLHSLQSLSPSLSLSYAQSQQVGKMSDQEFPPVLAPSIYQHIFMAAGGIVSLEEHSSFAFSEEFRDIYGEPTHFYTDWRRLVNVEFNEVVDVYRPHKYRAWSFLQLNKGFAILDLSRKVDSHARKLGLPLLDRRQMEALYVRILLEAYDRQVRGGNIMVSALRLALFLRTKTALEYFKKSLRHLVNQVSRKSFTT